MLYEKHPRYGQLVKACSAEAVTHGVRPGMPLAEAQTCLHALVNGEPKATANPPHSRLRLAVKREYRKPAAVFSALHDAHRDQEALTKLAELCERFSPVVGLDQTDEPDCLLMDISGLAKLFGGEKALACTITKAFHKRGFEVRIAIADTIGAARAVARFVTGHDRQPYRIVPQGDRKALDTVPVAALRLTTRTMEQLKRLGIDTIGQLRQLPRTSLAARFKDDLIEGLDRIVGDAQEVIVSHKRVPELAARWLFEHPTTHHGAIDYVLERLLHQLSGRLIEQGQGVLQLECRFVCKKHDRLGAVQEHACRTDFQVRPQTADGLGSPSYKIIKVGLFQPTVSPQHLLGLIGMQLERLILPDAVEEIHVVAISAAPREQRQNDLFASGSRDDQSKLALLVERLSSRLGRDRVARAQLQAESQVELAYRRVPLTGGPTHESGGRPFVVPPSGGLQRRSAFPNRLKAGPQTIDTSTQAALGPMLRPLRILDPPEPVDVIGIALDGPPAMFRYRCKQYRIARHFGPERIETGWWRGPSSCRDYYRVETESGNRMWLFRRLQDKKWFLHGEFA